MKSFLFKQAILEAKIKTLEKYGEGVTRRLLPKGFNLYRQPIDINLDPERWRIDLLPTVDGSVRFDEIGGDISNTLFIKPRYQVGDVAYFREPFAIRRDGVQTMTKFEYDEVRKALGTPELGVKFLSPYSMAEKLARHFVTVTEATPERLDIKNLTPHEIELEGGEVALKFLAGYDGKWVFRITYKRVERP